MAKKGRRIMKGISVYMLSEESRATLAEAYPPQFEKFVGHHVTYNFGASDTDDLPPAGEYYVVGYAYEKERRINGSGIEALVVSIDGTVNRPDGKVYHITWSHGSSYAAKDSNRIVQAGWKRIDEPVQIYMEPTFIPFR